MGLNVLLIGYQSHLQYCNVAILPVVTKDLLISPRFSLTFFLPRCKFSTLTTVGVPTNLAKQNSKTGLKAQTVA